MRVVTLRGTYEIDLAEMKVLRPGGSKESLRRVPSPVTGERMVLETSQGELSTEQVVRVEP